MRLRSHLVTLVLAALVPVLGFAALVMRENARLQLSATERGMRDTAAAVARTVDKELETAITALEALAQSEHLDTMTLAPFYTLCERVSRSQDWVNILLLDREGQTLLQTSVPLGRPRPSTKRPELFAQVRDQRRPAVSNLFDGSLHRNIVAVYVPVVRASTTRFVLTVGLRAGDFGDLLRAQKFAPDTVAVLQDREATIIARTRAEAETVGRRVRSPTPGREGWLRSRLIEGTEVYVAFATAPSPGGAWSSPPRSPPWRPPCAAGPGSSWPAPPSPRPSRRRSRFSSAAASRGRSAAWSASPAPSSGAIARSRCGAG